MATLLIVEDDRKTNEAICEYLKSAGHMLISADMFFRLKKGKLQQL